MTRAALEVWGDPIEHSLSPRLHTAAYAELGWEWTYGRRRVDEASFEAELRGAASTIRGLSLTMPLKARAHAVATTLDERAHLTGAANTLVRRGDGWHGFNTDVGGIVAALGEQGVSDVVDARIVGAGATAASALVAVSEIGARRVEVMARRPGAAAALIDLGRRLEVVVEAAPWASDDLAVRGVTIATLPGGVEVDGAVADALARAGGPLLDVVYGHWPTALSDAWERNGAPAQNGAGMLLHQAVLQIRAFATGDVAQPLPREAAVVAVMRRALMGD